MESRENVTKECTSLLPIKRGQRDEEDRKGKKIKQEDNDDDGYEGSGSDIEQNDEDDSSESEEEDEESTEDSESSENDSEGRPPRVRGNLPAYLFLDSAWGEKRSKQPIYIFKKTKLFKIEMGCSRGYNSSRLLTGVKGYIQEKLSKKSRVTKPFAFQFQKKNKIWAGADEFMTLHEEIFDRKCTFIELSKACRIGIFPIDQQLILAQSVFPRTIPVKLLSTWNYLEFTLEETVQLESATTFDEFEEAVQRVCQRVIYNKDVEDIEPLYRRANGIKRKYLPMPTTFAEFIYLLGEIVLHRLDDFELDPGHKMTLGQMFKHLRKQRVIPSIPRNFRHCK